MPTIRPIGRTGALLLAIGACVPPGPGPLAAEPDASAPRPVEPERARPSLAPAAGELRVATEGDAPIPGDLRLAVLWANEDAQPPIAISAVNTAANPDGSWQIADLPAPPEPMILRVGDLAIALGYLVAYHDSDGDGVLTPAASKPWRWPEFRGGINSHVLVHAIGPIPADRPPYHLVGPHPGGLQLMQVQLTANCEGDSCRGHDSMSLGSRPQQLTLILPAEPASFRFPNLD